MASTNDSPVEIVDSEKYAHVEERSIDKSQYTEGHGDLQIFQVSDSDNLKLAKDGKTVLIPQPSDSPNDPLNWSWSKKHSVLASFVFASLLTDFGITYGTVLFQAQAVTFGLSIPATANSVNGALFLQGAGGILAVPLIQRIGRLPVLFFSQLLCALFVMGASLSTGYASFTAFRALQGFFNTAPQVVGLSFIHDMFFFHERVRRINIWVFCLLGGPFLGPFVSGWIITTMSWKNDFGILAGLHGFATLLVVILGDETLYDRNNPQPRQKGFAGKLKCMLGLTGIKATGRPTVWTVFKDLVRIQIKPQIFFITTCYVMVLVAWVIGVNVTISLLVTPPPRAWSFQHQALSWLAPLLGAVIGELWGHWYNQYLQNSYIRRHDGKYVLENRLWGVWPATIVGIIGYIVYGQAIEKVLHESAVLISWAMIAFSMIAGTTAVSAYCLDSFPKHSSLVAAIINLWRTTGGFCVGFFQLKWISTSGAGTSFGLQAMILGVAFLGGVVSTQFLGRKWRLNNPPPVAEN